ncbi:MAG TPA: TonB-dependent receptor [Polyangia bacterium]|nr:TonB-dependent receptor [Polyangia bacterium]
MKAPKDERRAKRFGRPLLLPALWLAFCLLPSAASANGAVEGTVKLAGKPPALPPHAVVKDNAVCGATKQNEAVLVGPGGALGNVVVSLRLPKPASPPPPTTGAAIDQVGCTYKPHVQAVTVGTSLTLVNSDRVLHNIHGSTGPVQTFNVAMPIKDQRLPTKLTRPGLVRLQCDAGHTWMNAWLYVFEHPYFAVTGADGRFELKDVPAGHYTVELWHEPADGKGAGVTSTVEVDVKDGAPAKADAVFDLRGP